MPARPNGLHYNWHRHYDASLGRYTQPDPLGFVDGPGVYGYVKAQPLQGVDTDGRMAQLCLANPAACGAAATKFAEMCLAAGTYIWMRTKEEDIKQKEYEHAKRFCDEPDPHHDRQSVSCSLMSLVINKAKHCAKLYQNWDDRWHPRRHAQKIAERLARAQTYKEMYHRRCVRSRW